MIDHLLRFNDETEAQNDSVLKKYWSEEAGWRGDVCLPGIHVWQPSQNIIEETEEGPVERRQLESYFYINIALPNIDSSLSSHPNMRIVADREAAASGRQFIRAAAVSPEELSQFALEPVFAGSMYPFGELAT